MSQSQLMDLQERDHGAVVCPDCLTLFPSASTLQIHLDEDICAQSIQASNLGWYKGAICLQRRDFRACDEQHVAFVSAQTGNLTSLVKTRQHGLALWICLTLRLYLTTCPLHGILKCIAETFNHRNVPSPTNITSVILSFLRKL